MWVRLPPGVPKKVVSDAVASAKANFKRISQIEQSLFHVLKRDFRKYGWQGLKETWKKKSKKYMNDFVKKIVVEKGIDIPISIFVNIGEALIFG